MSTDKTLADVQPGARVRLGDALLPCPFCGAPAERIDFGIGSGENEGGSCIACTVCQHSGPIEFGYKENFISNWNRRSLAARQPVGEIPSKVLSAISGLAHVAKANVPSLADKHVAIIDAWLYAAPTAQAVDLGQFREAVLCWRREQWSRTTYVPDSESSPDANVEKADRLLALIDSQAVGNG